MWPPAWSLAPGPPPVRGSGAGRAGRWRPSPVPSARPLTDDGGDGGTGGRGDGGHDEEEGFVVRQGVFNLIHVHIFLTAVLTNKQEMNF